MQCFVFLALSFARFNFRVTSTEESATSLLSEEVDLNRLVDPPTETRSSILIFFKVSFARNLESSNRERVSAFWFCSFRFICSVFVTCVVKTLHSVCLLKNLRTPGESPQKHWKLLFNRRNRNNLGAHGGKFDYSRFWIGKKTRWRFRWR